MTLGPITHRCGELAVTVRWFDAAAGVIDPGDDVAVWLYVPGGDDDATLVEPWLSEGERARRDRIQHPRALAEMLAGRRLIRQLLAPLVGVSPAELRLVENAHGALAIDPATHGPCGWCFNLSHTDGLLALALARAPVGVDVEWTSRPGRTVELAERYFAPAEIAALRELTSDLQRDRFFDLWTLKEAYIKARGMGLAIPLRDFAFALTNAVTLTTAPSLRHVPDEGWRFRLDQVGPHHRLALALAPG